MILDEATHRLGMTEELVDAYRKAERVGRKAWEPDLNPGPMSSGPQDSSISHFVHVVFLVFAAVTARAYPNVITMSRREKRFILV